MAIRTPLKIDSTNLKEMSSTDTGNIISRMVYLYFTDPSVQLQVLSTHTGNMTAMSDTRTLAGVTHHSTTAHPGEGTTAEPTTFTVNHDRLNEIGVGAAALADTNNIAFPVWNNSGNIQAMTLAEMYDSFCRGTAGALKAIPEAQPYKIDTASSGVSGYTNVSTTPVFIDTSADVSAFTADNLDDTVDRPEDVASYYLHKKNAVETEYSSYPLYIDSNQNLKEYTEAEFDAILKKIIKFTAESLNEVGGMIQFRIQTSTGAGDTTCGTLMTNKKYNGAGAYTERQVEDDYRSQEFPNGTLTTMTSYRLIARNDPS